VKLQRHGILAGVALTAVMAVAACGTDNNTGGSPAGGTSGSAATGAIKCASGSLTAQGSTAQGNAMNQWIKDYQTACSGATINYQLTGSGAGQQAFLGGTAVFAGSDSPLGAADQPKADARCAGGKAIHLPMVVGPLAVVFHVSGVTALSLKQGTIAKIFAGTVTTWNDPAIAADNPGVTLPATKILTVHRQHRRPGLGHQGRVRTAARRGPHQGRRRGRRAGLTSTKAMSQATPSRPAEAAHQAVSAAPRPRPDGPPDDGDPGATATTLPRRRRFGPDSLFRGLSTASGVTVLVVIVAIAAFLIYKAVPALRADKENFLTYVNWFPDDGDGARFGIGALAAGTVIVSALALLLAVPVALGIALCLSHYAPRRIATGLGFVIDLLAAVPSVIFGLWGRDYLIGPVRDLSGWLHRYLGWLPVFGSNGPYGKSVMLGAVVLAIMILPITTSLSREVFRQTPTMNEEAALALGATRWEMIRLTVLPYGRPGLIAAVMLGLGRALGETIALALVLGSTFTVSADLLGIGGNSIAANIANRFGDAGGTGRGALIASGLVLFAITLVVNVSARAIVYRRREFVGSAT